MIETLQRRTIKSAKRYLKSLRVTPLNRFNELTVSFKLGQERSHRLFQVDARFPAQPVPKSLI